MNTRLLFRPVIAVAFAPMLLLALTSCSTYSKTPSKGKFYGEPRMVPVTPNTFFFYRPRDKDDVLFAYEPGEGSPYFGRFEGNRITPDAMLTTGASVPRRLWMFPGLAPFDYTRAALIHDWLFEARHRYEIGTWLVKSGMTEANRRKGARLGDMYAAYGCLTQNAAADIYAECIRCTMDQGVGMRQDLTGLITKDENPQARARLEELRESLKPARQSNFWLWAHRWFTSEECWVPTAKRTWEAQHDDLGLYELIARNDTAVKKGYMSPWLRKKFRAVYEEPSRGAVPGDGRLAGVDEAVKATTRALVEQMQTGRLRPRVYLEVEDAASQAILQARAREFPEVDLKSDRKFTSLGANVLTVYYYNSEDKAGAQRILETLGQMLPAGTMPSGAKVVKLNDGGLYRPKHYDLHISRDIALQLRQ